MMRKIPLSDFTKMFANGSFITADSAEECFQAVISEQKESELEAFFKAWNSIGITADEVYHFAKVMRKRMKRICTKGNAPVELVGTGGSSIKTFNVSTAAALVAAGSGLLIAKHGNRAATSMSGSADVLNALGVDTGGEPEAAERCLAQTGICFMFAPKFHSLSAQLANVRKRLASPTIFNNLGPLCNPAGAGHQVIGVWDKEIMHRTASALLRLGTNRSWIVNGGGLDEISIETETTVYEVTADCIKEFEISPEDFGVERGSIAGCGKLNPEESAELITEILQNKHTGSSAENIVLINAAAAIYIKGDSTTMSGAFQKARSSLRNGAAMAKLEQLKFYTNQSI